MACGVAIVALVFSIITVVFEALGIIFAILYTINLAQKQSLCFFSVCNLNMSKF
jgi:hypothetical protein